MNEVEGETESCFIDTNIWLYAFIQGSDSQKTAKSKSIIEDSESIVISTQVVNEACINLIKKAKFSEQKIQQIIQSFFAEYRVIELNHMILTNASNLRDRYTFSFWDSLIVASALSVGASILYSEDMHDGLVVDKQLRIVNPLETQ